MNCRTISTFALVALFVLAGCLAAPGTVVDRPAPPAERDDSVEPHDPPARPDPVTADSVRPYAAAVEEVFRHNAILAENANVRAVTAQCTAESVERTVDGFRVTVDCIHAWEMDNDGEVAIADGAPYTVYYLVTEERTERGEDDFIY